MSGTQTIDTRAASGAIEYTWPLTIVEQSTPPKDISTDTLLVSLGTKSTPGSWFTPDIDTPGADAAGTTASVQNTRTVQVLIGDSRKPAAGTYTLWTKVGDSPEVVPRSHQSIKILADA